MKIRLHLAMMAAAALAAAGCAFPKAHNLPPAQQILEPGPGVGGPGPGVLPPAAPAAMMTVAMPSVQVLFAKPEAMQVRWDVGSVGTFDSDPLVVPGRQNFPQGGIYRMKLTNIEGKEGVELYPTLEVGPVTPRSEAFLAHNAIPVQFTPEDFDQLLAGNFVTKVIYLPDPEFQELALAGVETLVSTRLDPGVDPITEADRRGSILAVVRLGNKDVELAGAEEGIYGGGFDGGGGYCPPGYGYGGGGGFGGGGILGPGGGGLPPNYVAGVTSAQYGMPLTGTPLGLPGPPHIPLGGPAGLQRHIMKNHTHMHIPDPTEQFKIHVRSQPAQSYPQPANRVWIREQMIHPSLPFEQPKHDMHERVGGGAGMPGGGHGSLFGHGGAGNGEYYPPEQQHISD